MSPQRRTVCSWSWWHTVCHALSLSPQGFAIKMARLLTMYFPCCTMSYLLQVDLSYVFMSWQTVVMILWQKNAQFLCSQDQIVSKLKRVDISTRNTYENINYLFTSINIKPAHLPADSLSYSCRPWLKDVHSSSLQTGKTLTQQATRNVPNLPHTQKTDSSRHKSIN